MTFLSLFVVIPIVMLFCLWIARNDSQVRGIMMVGSVALLALAIYLVFAFVGARETMTAEQFPFLFGDAIPWFEPLNIYYRTGVDGIAVVMILLSAIIVITGTFPRVCLVSLSVKISSQCSCFMRWPSSQCTCLLAFGEQAPRSIQP